MKVLINDGMQIQRGTGIGKYTLYLYRALKAIGCDAELDRDFKRGDSGIRDRFQYLRYINSRAFFRKAQGYDVVLFTNYAVPIRKLGRALTAVTVHDLAAFIQPRTLPTAYRLYNRTVISLGMRRADCIFTVSESVRNEILRHFPRAAGKLRHTWEGVFDGIGPLAEYPPYENQALSNIDQTPFFLFISTVEKRKNVGLILSAFIRLKREEPLAKDYKLVLAGRPGFGYEEFVRTAEMSGFPKDILFAGYISDADCNRLYNRAKAFLFPSVYEGFGLAQVECMKCHLPIILSDIPTNREVSREYGNFFSLKDEGSLVDQMRVITSDQYDYARKNVLADRYIQDFDWNRIAGQYVEILAAAVEGKRCADGGAQALRKEKWL